MFVFRSTNPQLLRVETEHLELPARASANIVLLVNKFPQGTKGLDATFLAKYSDIPVYVLVTDERGHSEETMLVHLKYSR